MGWAHVVASSPLSPGSWKLLTVFLLDPSTCTTQQGTRNFPTDNIPTAAVDGEANQRKSMSFDVAENSSLLSRVVKERADSLEPLPWPNCDSKLIWVVWCHKDVAIP